MFNQFIDVSLLPEREAFIASQRLQAWLRLALGVIFFAYIYFHGSYFDQLVPAQYVAIACYQAVNLISFGWIQRVPYSLSRVLLLPVLDCVMIFMAMWADGGHMSVTYLLLLSPIFGNGLRYGSNMLRYCQVLSLVTLAAICVTGVYTLQLPIDWLGLAAEVLGIFYISIYAYHVIKKSETTAHERQQAEASAYQLIADTPHPAFTYDMNRADAPIIYANPAMAMITSERPEALPGKPIAELVIEEDREALIATAHQRQQRDQLHQCYVRMRDQRGDTIQLLCEMRRTIQAGREIGLAYLTNISESERLQSELAEAQKQAYAAALVAGVAHDFRNLLSGMIGHAELVAMELAEPEYNAAQLQADVQQIIRAGQHGSEMVEQLLVLGRSDESDKTVQDIGPAISQMVQLARVQLPPDITLGCEIDDDLPLICANIAQLEQVLLNLVNNAAQAMPERRGKITISIRGQQLDQATRGVQMTVRDNGNGIDPAHLPFIFKPFWSTRKERGGTGLGLPMVQRIVRWHDGTIDVDSKPGQGTVFNIFLPEYVAQEQESLAPVATMPAMPSAARPMRPWSILLVEDQAEVLAIHKAFLQKMGHRVQTACNGREAFELLRAPSSAFDMVLTDYMMPEMDGVALCQRVHEIDATLPVTIATAFREDSVLEQVHGVHTVVISKPVSYAQLYAHIAMLQASQQQPTAQAVNAE